MLLKYTSLILILLVSTSYSRTPALLYSKADLDILYENRQHIEFLAHAKDLRPTERDDQWRAQVLEMAQQFIDEVNQQKAYNQYNKNEIERLMKLGNVAQSEVFALARKDFMTGFLESCFSNSKPNCLQSAQKILEQTPKQRELPDIPASFGSVLLENKITGQEVIYPFMKFAFISERSQFLCRKVDVKNYIFSWFKTFNSTPRTQKEIKLFSADNFHPACLNAVLNYFVKNFNQLRSPIDREQIIHWLSATEYLPKDEIQTLLAIYLLKNPVNGDIFNLAWNSIKEMGENYTKREKVIHKLQTLDPLPDEIFNLSDPLREKTLFNLVAKNLPEYVKYYSQSCLDYYSGSRNFPNGNPTIHCNSFLTLFKQKYGNKHPKVKKLEDVLRF